MTLSVQVLTNFSLCGFNQVLIVEPRCVQALKNPNPLKDVEALAVLAVVVLS